MIRVSELRERDVVNVNDGRRLGLIKDLDLDLDKGRVKAIIIPAPGGIFGKLSRIAHDYVIPGRRSSKLVLTLSWSIIPRRSVRLT